MNHSKKHQKLVIDATGVDINAKKWTSKLYKSWRRIDRRDLESTGRYIMYFDQGEKDLSEFDPDYCIIHLDQDIAPGGYGWVFPKGENKVNIGLGVEKTLLRITKQKTG